MLSGPARAALGGAPSTVQPAAAAPGWETASPNETAVSVRLAVLAVNSGGTPSAASTDSVGSATPPASRPPAAGAVCVTVGLAPVEESWACAMTSVVSLGAETATAEPGAARCAASPVPSATEATPLSTGSPPAASVTAQWAGSSVPASASLTFMTVSPRPCVVAVNVAGGA